MTQDRNSLFTFVVVFAITFKAGAFLTISYAPATVLSALPAISFHSPNNDSSSNRRSSNQTPARYVCVCVCVCVCVYVYVCIEQFRG
jgi:hypothetical protein